MSEPITFTAALAGANTQARCLSVGADGDGKLVLEFSATELSAVLRLIAYAQGKSFKVSVED